jgi:hypothetical protein
LRCQAIIYSHALDLDTFNDCLHLTVQVSVGFLHPLACFQVLRCFGSPIKLHVLRCPAGTSQLGALSALPLRLLLAAAADCEEGAATSEMSTAGVQCVSKLPILAPEAAPHLAAILAAVASTLAPSSMPEVAAVPDDAALEVAHLAFQLLAGLGGVGEAAVGARAPQLSAALTVLQRLRPHALALGTQLAAWLVGPMAHLLPE